MQLFAEHEDCVEWNAVRENMRTSRALKVCQINQFYAQVHSLVACYSFFEVINYFYVSFHHNSLNNEKN